MRKMDNFTLGRFEDTLENNSTIPTLDKLDDFM